MPDQSRIGFKVTVTKSYDVYIYYGDGIMLDADSEDSPAEQITDMVMYDAEDAALNRPNDVDLVVKRFEDTDTGNGFVAFVDEFATDCDIRYHVEQMPHHLKEALERKFTEEQKKDIKLDQE